MYAGASRVEITPPFTVPYLGFEPRHDFFKGVHDPLYGRAVVFDRGAGPLAIVCVDSIGFDNSILGGGRNFTEEVRRRASERTEIAEKDIFLCATHAHSTPESIGFRPLPQASLAWLDSLVEKLATSIEFAIRDLKPASLRLAVGEVRGITKNRRVPAGPVDPRVSVLYIDRENSEPIVLLHFTCHPITVQVQPLVSADFPGEASAIVERQLGGVCLFLQGACGDQNPINSTSDFDDVKRYGMALAGEVLKRIALLPWNGKVESEPVLRSASRTLLLPRRPLPEREPLEKTYKALPEKIANAKDDEERRRLLRKRKLTEEALILIDGTRDPIPAEVQVLRLGSVALVGLPGEPLLCIGTEIESRSPAPLTLTVGYANGFLGYLAPRLEWERGGYEVSEGPWCRVSPEGVEQLLRTSTDLLCWVFSPR